MQSVNDFSNFKTHEKFSKQLKKLSDTFLKKNLHSQEIKNLVGKWIQHFDSLGMMEAVNLSGAFNTLSKLGIFGKKWQKEDQGNFKSLIVKLIKQGNAIDSTKFNSQAIANIFNALSKWDVLDNQEFKDSKGEFKSLIVKLIKQGNTIDSTKFNSQAIANSYDALYKFSVFDNEKWNNVQLTSIKNFIVKLAEEGKKVYVEFNSQEIANTFHAFSRLDVFDDSKWTSGEQDELKSLIVNLASRSKVYENYNLKDISRTYKALCKWDILNSEKKPSSKFTGDEFKALVTKLKNQVIKIAEEKCGQFDDIRFSSKIIVDLPELKSRNLITSERELLIPLMQCLSASVDKSEDSDLKENLTKENILSGLEGFANIINGLEDKSSLKEEFNDSLIKILNKLSNVQLDSDYVDKIQSKVKDVIKSEVIEKKDSLNNTLNKLSPEQNGQLPEKAGNEPQTYLNDPTADKQLQRLLS